MRIGLVYELPHEFEGNASDASPENSAESASPDEIETIAITLESLGHTVLKIGNIWHLTRFIANEGRVDLFFNYAAGLRGSAREAQVPALLEAHGLPYTGADPASLSLCLDKTITKRLWREAGLPTPDFVQLNDIKECDSLPGSRLEFPLFVKPIHEGSSIGISDANIVRSPAELRRQAGTLLAEYKQPVLIETYLPGKEYSVGILGSEENAYPIGVAETSSAKTLGIKEKKAFTERSFLPVSDPDLGARLVELGIKAYKSVNCRIIGRVDIKLDRDGRPMLLEINPNPGLHPVRSILPEIARQRGWSYGDLLGELLRISLSRRSS